ncbi:MAG: diaminopimelate epimerase [Candidatus Cloacimonadales bacterium]|jgi:diaminopimelate epimerase|nr:diaminopimelate epimerase [Candidatus Cloacimonadales bacterium]
MIEIPFLKMHGQGNDYLFIEHEYVKEVSSLNNLSITMSERHFGVGSDGIVILSKTPEADIKMDIFNADGSLAEMCGTALRCVVALYSERLNKNEISVLTGSGIKTGLVENGLIKVNMGPVDLLEPHEVFIAVDNRLFAGYYISVGNPHFVIFEHIENEELRKWGPKIENHSFFEDRTNVEFVEITSKNSIGVKVWERGSGITLACGTGASACVFASHKFRDLADKITVDLPGGSINVSLDKNGHAIIAGSVDIVFEGKFNFHEV